MDATVFTTGIQSSRTYILREMDILHAILIYSRMSVYQRLLEAQRMYDCITAKMSMKKTTFF